MASRAFGLVLRLIWGLAAGLATAVAIAIGYSVLDLYLVGNGVVVPDPGGGALLHYRIGTVLILVVPPLVSLWAFFRSHPTAE